MALSQQFFDFLQSLRSELPIDRDRLEEECSNQPQLYDRIGQEVVKASRLAKDAKADYDEKEAETELSIRKNPGSYGVEKVTEATITAAKTIDQAVREKKRAWLTAEEEYQALRTLHEAMGQRKSMLRDLTDLFVHNYYSAQGLAEPSERIQNRAGEYKKIDNERFENDIANVRSLRKQQRTEERSKED